MVRKVENELSEVKLTLYKMSNDEEEMKSRLRAMEGDLLKARQSMQEAQEAHIDKHNSLLYEQRIHELEGELNNGAHLIKELEEEIKSKEVRITSTFSSTTAQHTPTPPTHPHTHIRTRHTRNFV